MSDFITVFFFGIIALAILKELIPLAARLADNLILWVLRRPAARARQWRSLNPTEQNLQRASHGAALMLLPVIAALYLLGPGEVVNDLAAVATDPAANILPAAAVGLGVVLFVYGFARLLAGWRRSIGVRDGLLTARAFVKLALGTGLLCWHVPPDPIAPSLYPWAALALFLAALWLVITGAARLVCLTLGGGRARRLIDRLRARRAAPMRPASSGFWADMRESFARGRDGRPWRG